MFRLETSALSLGDANWAPFTADRQPNAECHSDLQFYPDQSEHIGFESINGKLKSLLYCSEPHIKSICCFNHT